MLTQLRDKVYVGDKDAYTDLADLKEKGITCVVIVANEMIPPNEDESGIKVFKLGLGLDKPNIGHVKDLACHTPKYMVQNGETVLVQGVTGMKRAAFIACRMVCELENKGIYEIFQELKAKVPEFDVGIAYL